MFVKLTRIQNLIRLRLNIKFIPEIGIFKKFDVGIGLHDTITVNYTISISDNESEFHRFFESDSDTYIVVNL